VPFHRFCTNVYVDPFSQRLGFEAMPRGPTANSTRLWLVPFSTDVYTVGVSRRGSSGKDAFAG
jgi:hypothetical protein